MVITNIKEREPTETMPYNILIDLRVKIPSSFGKHAHERDAVLGAAGALSIGDAVLFQERGQ